MATLPLASPPFWLAWLIRGDANGAIRTVSSVNSCVPVWWSGEGTRCPWGTPLLQDVTYPANPSFVDDVAVVYSETVTVVIICILVHRLVADWRLKAKACCFAGDGEKKTGTSSLFMGFLSSSGSVMLTFAVIFILGVNEKILKKWLACPRPGAAWDQVHAFPTDGLDFDALQPTNDEILQTIRASVVLGARGSCAGNCGSPSGHSATSLGVVTWLLLEHAVLRSRGDKRVFADFAPLSLPAQMRLYLRQFCGIGLSLVALLPVPWSRIRLQDHSLEQVAAGSIEGITLGLLFFLLHVHLTKRFLRSVDGGGDSKEKFDCRLTPKVIRQH